MITYTETDFLKDPYPSYEQLREKGDPFYASFLGHEGWFITGYDKALAMLKDERFHSAVPTPKNSLAKVQKQMVLYKNGAEHKRLRSIIARTFSKQSMNDIETTIEVVADRLLSQMHEKEKIEIISDYAFPLSAAVIAKILGLTIERLDDLRRWSNLLVQTIDFSRNQTNLRAGRQALLEIHSFFKPILEERLITPKDDVISKLAHESIKDRSLSFDEWIANCILLLIAGQETTVNLISTGILLLLKDKEQLHLLREENHIMINAIEEILRYESPTQLTARVASKDIDFYGNSIRRGERVYILIGAANRDSRQFLNADIFDITRKNNRHLAFGYGEHFCIGATLARIEGKIAIQRFFERFPNTELSEKDVIWRELIGFRALKQLCCNVK